MEDVAILMEEYVKELLDISAGKVKDISRLLKLASSIKQYVTPQVKGTITRECNSAKRFTAEVRVKITSTINRNMSQAINTATLRYMNYVINM